MRAASRRSLSLLLGVVASVTPVRAGGDGAVPRGMSAPVPSAAAAERPVLHILAVGINKYRDATLELTLARGDAEAIVSSFRAVPRETSLFREVRATLLADESATRPAILAAFDRLAAEAGADDVVLVFLAGHGEVGPADEKDDARETFFFIPHEIPRLDAYGSVWRHGLSGDLIDQKLRAIPALKKVLVYDACHSGAVVLRGAAETQAAALRVLARARGIHVLAAATAQQAALESDEAGHGVMTRAILDGLAGAAATPDGVISVRGLMTYVEKAVPALAERQAGSAQWPMADSRGQDFPLALRR